MPYLESPREAAGHGQHLPVMHCCGFHPNPEKLKRPFSQLTQSGRRQHLRDALCTPVPLGPHQTCKKNQTHPELLGTSLSWDLRPIGSQGRPRWGWTQGGPVWPRPPPASFRTKAGSRDPPSLLFAFCFRVSWVDTGDREGPLHPRKLLTPPCAAQGAPPLAFLSM